MDPKYKEMFCKANEELEKLQVDKANVETELASLSAQIEAMTKTVNAIAPLIGEPTIPQAGDLFPPVGSAWLKAAGISVATQYVIDCETGKSFSATDIRNELERLGWDWSKYKNPLSTIHTVLKRLADADAIKRVVGVLEPTGRYSSKRPRTVTQVPPPPTSLR